MDNKQTAILLAALGVCGLIGYWLYTNSGVGRKSAMARSVESAKPEEIVVGESSSIQALGVGTVFDPSIVSRDYSYKPALLPGY